MTPQPVLYVGIAGPLTESARLWLASLPEGKALPERRKLLGEFPAASIGAYGLSFPDAPEYTAIAFRTGVSVSQDRVRAKVESWCGAPPDLLPQGIFEPVSGLDHRRALADLQRQLDGKGIRIIPRVGLTLGQLQADLAELAPELVLIDCHGTKEGCLILEDGRGRAHYVPGDRLFAALNPRPAVLFLAACHSEKVLDRAKDAADWRDAAIVRVLGDTPIEVSACVAFQSMFYPALLRGETAGRAFDAAQQYLANDPTLGQLSVAVGEVAPSDKFRINDAGRQVQLKVTERPGNDAESDTVGTRPAPPHSTLRRRASEHFVGRRREMAKILDELLPLPPGMHRGPGAGEPRLITLTKEGGIGKTAIATEITDWVYERNAFPGGMLALACERFKRPDDLLSALLTGLGVDPQEQRGNLLQLLRSRASQVMTNGRATLLVLDNLDQLIAGAEEEDEPQPAKHAQRTRAILETMLDAAPDLRVLATCRWPLGMPEYELPLEVGPMAEDECRDVFLAHLESPHHKMQGRQTWELPDSPIRQLVKMSGRHPQALQLLARQMTRPGMTLDKLRDEARQDLLGVLTDPLASDDEQDRLRKVEMSYELSYRHLGDQGKLLFERLSRLPGGIWCGQWADRVIKWENLLGRKWRETMEKELDYFALVHFEPDRGMEGHGTFEMLNPMREFARSKYQAGDHAAWEKDWLEFWDQRLDSADAAISGRIPEGMDLPDDQRAAAGEESQQLAKLVVARTQANWTTAFEHAAEAHPAAFEQDVAMTLNNLGTVLGDLGERQAAREAYSEALDITPVWRTNGPLRSGAIC